MSESQTRAVDLAVVGGGAIGLSVAWEALRHGLSVTVLESATVGSGSSHVAAGMLAPIAEARPAEEPLLEFGLASARLYPEFVATLTPRADQVGYRTCGTLLVARDDDEARWLEREHELRLHYGLAVRRLRPSAARRLEPALIPALRLALELPDDHAVDPRALIEALAGAITDAGGVIREGTAARGIETTAGHVSGVGLEDGSLQPAQAVVLAAGAWTPEISGVHAPPARPVKGQILRLHDPAGPGLLSRVVRMGPSYIVPRGDGRYVIGATSEERGFDTTVTAGAVSELLRDAGDLVPGIAELVIDELSAGLRPGTPDNLPVIGPGATPGLHWATGHGRGGILLAPATARLVCAGLLGAPGDSLGAAFAPGRFAAVPAGSPA